MPRCRKSYRGSRSKAQVPRTFFVPLSSFVPSSRSPVSFLPVRLLDRSTGSIGEFHSFGRGVYARRRTFFPRAVGLGPSLDVSTCETSRLPGSRRRGCQRESPVCANVSQFKPFISGEKNSRNAQIQRRLPTATREIAAFYPCYCPNFENLRYFGEKNETDCAESLSSILHVGMQPSSCYGQTLGRVRVRCAYFVELDLPAVRQGGSGVSLKCSR